MAKKLKEKGNLESVDLHNGVIAAKMHDGFLKGHRIRIMLPHDDKLLNWLAGETGNLIGTSRSRCILIPGKDIKDHKITITIE